MPYGAEIGSATPVIPKSWRSPTGKIESLSPWTRILANWRWYAECPIAEYSDWLVFRLANKHPLASKYWNNIARNCSRVQSSLRNQADYESDHPL